MARVKVSVSLRVVPEVRDVGMARAAAETRSFASYIESLIVRDARDHGVEPVLAPRVRAVRSGMRLPIR